MINHLSDALATVRTPGGKDMSAKRAEEATAGLAAARVELHQVRQQVEHKDKELETLIPQVVNSRLQCADRLRTKDAELDRLQTELSRAQEQLRQVQVDVDAKDEEINRLLPQLLVSRMQSPRVSRSRGGDADQLRIQLESARAELSRKDVELRKAQRDLEDRERYSADDLRRLADKDAEIACLRQMLEAQQRPVSKSMVPASRGIRELDFDIACDDMNRYLERREHQLNARETKLNAYSPRVSTINGVPVQMTLFLPESHYLK